MTFNFNIFLINWTLQFKVVSFLLGFISHVDDRLEAVPGLDLNLQYQRD